MSYLRARDPPLRCVIPMEIATDIAHLQQQRLDLLEQQELMEKAEAADHARVQAAADRDHRQVALRYAHGASQRLDALTELDKELHVLEQLRVTAAALAPTKSESERGHKRLRQEVEEEEEVETTPFASPTQGDEDGLETTPLLGGEAYAWQMIDMTGDFL